MKKLLLILLSFLCLETKAQIIPCDSISYSTTSTINYPLIVSGNISGLSNMVDTIIWSWSVCNSTMCYTGSGANASFGQVSLTDTLKVCYDVLIDINGLSYTCMSCDTLIYNPNSYQWELSSHPLEIIELNSNIINDNRMYDLLGREIFEVPKGTIYIKNGKKYIINGRKP
tara:strand:+ start:312 stop:824 length:513 start_codon:yes stop_codon:yes gene_type:complete